MIILDFDLEVIKLLTNSINTICKCISDSKMYKTCWLNIFHTLSSEIFTLKSSWTKADVQPGLVGLCPKSVSADEMASAWQPSIRLLLIRRFLLSFDMSSDGAPKPHRDVSVHQNQKHLFTNTIICQTQQEAGSCPPVVVSSLPLIFVITFYNSHQ